MGCRPYFLHARSKCISTLTLCFCTLFYKLADIDSSPSKEEEDDDDDTMQNTVVLFSNTDKFVLMQVGQPTTQLVSDCINYISGRKD